VDKVLRLGVRALLPDPGGGLVDCRRVCNPARTPVETLGDRLLALADRQRLRNAPGDPPLIKE
jgi:hypothetical protein